MTRGDRGERVAPVRLLLHVSDVMQLPRFLTRPMDPAETARLTALIRSVETPPEVPPWFTAQLLRRLRRERNVTSSESRVDALLGWLLQPRHAFAGLALAVLLGGGLGLHRGQQATLHLAEVRYLDAIDPVVVHP